MASGLDSLGAVELRNSLQAQLPAGLELPATLLFDFPSINAISGYIASQVGLFGWRNLALMQQAFAVPAHQTALCLYLSSCAAILCQCVLPPMSVLPCLYLSMCRCQSQNKRSQLLPQYLASPLLLHLRRLILAALSRSARMRAAALQVPSTVSRLWMLSQQFLCRCEQHGTKWFIGVLVG
jgi:hypothetical protein